MSNNFNPKIKSFDLEEYEIRIDKIIAKSYSSPLMSNAKWKKMFDALDVDGLVLDQIRLKLVDRKEPIISFMPKSCDTQATWVGTNSPEYFYKEIVWLELLRTAKPYGFEDVPFKHYSQNVEDAERILNSIGKFEIEDNQTGLTIYGYKV